MSEELTWVKALQEHKQKMAELQAENKALKKENADLKARLTLARLQKEQGMAAIDKHRCALLAENKWLKEGYDKILACDFDDKCETAHGLAERYYFVPRSIIDQALQEKPK